MTDDEKPDGPPNSEHGRAYQPPLPAVPLEYSGRREAPPRRSSFGARFAIGFFGYIAFSFAWFWAGVNNGVRAATLTGGWLVATAVLLGLSLYLRLRHGYSGVGYGILSVLLLALVLVGGPVLLIIGICGGMRF